MYLRLKPRHQDEFTMFNMHHVLRVEPGTQVEKELPWCRLLHLPAHQDQEGNAALSVSEVSISFDEISMLLSGRWVSDPL